MIEKWGINTIKHPSKKALTSIKSGKSYTYEEASRIIYSLSIILNELSLRNDSIVALIIDFEPEWVLLDQAIILSGKKVIGIPKSLPDDQKLEILYDVKASLIIHDNDQTNSFKDFKLQNKFSLFNKAHQNMQLVSIDTVIDFFIHTGYSLNENKTIYLVSSSGTTSKIKAACIALKQTRIYGELITSLMGLERNDKVFSFLPLSQTRLQDIYLPLFVGAEVVFSSLDRNLISDIQNSSPTFIASPPFLFKLIMQEYKKLNTKISLKKFIGGANKLYTGTTPVDKELLNFFNNNGVPLYEAYGSSETCSMVSMNYPTTLNIGSQGKILPGVKVKIVNKEITVGGIGVSSGYYNNKQLNKKSFKNHFFYTGDIGVVSNSFLFLKGRAKDVVILDNSKKIFPQEIEGELNKLNIVNYAVLVGTGHKYLGLIIDINRKFTKEDLKLIETVIERYNKSKENKINNYRLYINKFSINSKELTTSFKLKRKNIDKVYKNEIQKICN